MTDEQQQSPIFCLDKVKKHLYNMIWGIKQLLMDGRTDGRTEEQIYPGWAGHPDGFLQAYPGWAGHPDGFLQVNPGCAGHPDGFLQVNEFIMVVLATLTGSSRLILVVLATLTGSSRYTCFAWAGGTCPRFAWAGETFFPVVLLCQFLVLVGNRFWFYILLYLCT
jgi:hypothetical protein